MGFDGVGNGVAPSLANVFNLAAHAHAVNLASSGQGAHHHGNVVFLAFAVDHVGEQKSFAIRFGNATAKLPANQGVQFGVFVDRAIDGDQQTLFVEIGQMLVQITVATLWCFRARRL